MIRKANQKDISRLAEILIFAKRTAYRKIFNNDKVSFGVMQVFPLAIEFQNCPQLLENIFVYDDEFPKGMINIAIKDNVVEIKELYIDPFFQNQGIGSKLIFHIENFVQELDITEIHLWVLEKNETGKRFYGKHGFLSSSDRKLEDSTTEYIVKLKKLL